MFFPGDLYNLASSAIIIVAVQVLFFIFAASLKTDKLTDISYSLTFIITALILFFGEASFSPLQIVLTLMVFLWGFRLGEYLFVRILKIGKDLRFDGIRESISRFTVFWILQAFTIWIVMLPVTIVLSLDQSYGLSILPLIGIIVWALGLIIESVADTQKYRAKTSGAKWIEKGLWRYSRHPNYFGESLIWIGIFLAAIPALTGWMWISLISPVYITALLLFGTGVPTVEKRHDKNYGDDPAYKEYKRKTSLFVPRPPKR